MRVLMVAPPGAGKGTQGAVIAAHFDIPHIATGDLLRERLALYHEVTHPIVAWYAERGILVTVDAMRPVERVGRQILTALEAMRSLVDHVPESARRPIDLTG